ncbi:MAG: hypothetical protein ACXV3D_06685 [Halobacteriota archaeon]
MSALRGAMPRRAGYLTYPTILLGVSTVVLITIDLASGSIAAGIGALALAAFVVVYAARFRPSSVGLYGFLLAEVSPVSLQANLVTALVYQAFCLLFLTAVIAPFPHIATIRTYTRPAVMTCLVAAISLGLAWGLVAAKSLNAPQAASLTGTIVVVVLVASLYMWAEPKRSEPASEV